MKAANRCPVLKLEKQALHLAKDLHKTLQRLRSAQQACATCPNRLACTTCSDLNAAITNALQSVWDEWSLWQ